MNQFQRLNTLKKHAKNFVSGPKEGRPIYTGIHYAKNGIAVVTNTHYLLQVENVHSHREPVILHHKTDDVIEGNYFNSEKIWPEKFQAEVSIGTATLLSSWAGYHTVAEMVVKDNNTYMVSLVIGDGCVVVTSKNTVAEYTGNLPGIVQGAECRTCYNPVYMKNILNAIRDFKPEVVVLKLSGARSPIVVTTDVGVSALLLPVLDI